MPTSASYSLPTVQIPILSILATGFCKTLFKQTTFTLSVLQTELCSCIYTGHVCYMCVCALGYIHKSNQYCKGLVHTVLSQRSFVVYSWILTVDCWLIFHTGLRVCKNTSVLPFHQISLLSVHECKCVSSDSGRQCVPKVKVCKDLLYLTCLLMNLSYASYCK